MIYPLTTLKTTGLIFNTPHPYRHIISPQKHQGER